MTMRYNSITNCYTGINTNVANSQVYYNLFNNNSIAIKVQKNVAIDVINNTFAGNMLYAIQSLEGSVVSSKNNIYYLSTSLAKAYDFHGDYNSDFNLFNIENSEFLNGYDKLTVWKSITKQDINSKIGDPLFMNSDEDDFRIMDGSPAINNGTNTNLLLDFFGTTVPQYGIPDIGFCESDSKLIESADNTNLSKSNSSIEVTVYPNPTAGKVFINMENVNDQPAQIQIIDEKGNTIISKNNNGKKLVMINMEKQIRGTYFAIISCDDQVISRKIIVL